MMLCISLQTHAKVAVLGASGGIGQPLSLLMKQSPLVSQLVLYDIQMTKGVAADLSHVETKAQVCSFRWSLICSYVVPSFLWIGIWV